jgi:nitrous oxide reductase
MSNIIKPDPYLDLYKAEKIMDPDAIIVAKQYQKHLVDAVDRIVELAHGQRDFVKSENDWLVVEDLLRFFASQWPMEWHEFKTSIPDIRRTRSEGGYSQTKEIKYIASVPPRFMKMVKVIFPAQEWDKKFMTKFIKRFPLFKIGGA